jgi:predicted TPR repeat methyltransferase
MKAPLFVSSGDLIADRRYQWALDHAARGDLAAAAEILVQTVELAPRFATAWFALAVIRDVQGDRDGAVAAFASARDSDPEDYHGARLHLARLGGGEATPAMTETYVRRLFDQHAPDFDQSLLERLEYRGPELLRDAVENIRQILTRPMLFSNVLDLGCGTGLAGEAFRPFAAQLTGVDLSPGMVEQARGKNIYDRLAAAELVEFLRGEPAYSYDLVLAADVFVYVADLAPALSGIARVLTPEGLLAFTVETHDGNGVRLAPTLRYAHGGDYVRAVLADAGLKPLRMRETSVRMEKGVPAPSLLIVAVRAAD